LRRNEHQALPRQQIAYRGSHRGSDRPICAFIDFALEGLAPNPRCLVDAVQQTLSLTQCQSTIHNMPPHPSTSAMIQHLEQPPL
jgi:hypothetical protein